MTRDKPRVERMVQYVRNNFFAGKSSPTSLMPNTERSSGAREGRDAHPRHHLRPTRGGVRRPGSTGAVGRPDDAV